MYKFIENIGVTTGASLIFLSLHIPLAMVIKNNASFSSFQAVSIFLVGCLAAITGRQLLALCIASYIVGAEVFWRMTGGSVFWEFGKYAVVIILLLAVFFRRKKKFPVLLIAYFLLLLPGVFFSTFETFAEWRMQISFCMSGSLSLFVCGLFFSGFALDKKDMQRMFICFIAPIVSVACITLFGIRQAPDIEWEAVSNFAASGGFGPNQVSGLLGAGALICVILFLLMRKNLVFILLSLWFLVQAILTFSRGGPIQMALSTLIFFLVLLAKKGRRYFFTLLVLGLFLIFTVFNYIVPALDKFTGGALTERYATRETIGESEIMDTSGRADIIATDIKIFLNNPLGIGAGKSPVFHEQELGESSAAHTEWSRILAEHGIFGLLAILVLLVWIIKRYRLTKESFMKATILSCVVYAFLYMSTAAMRTVLPGFLIGILGADFKDPEEK